MSSWFQFHMSPLSAHTSIHLEMHSSHATKLHTTNLFCAIYAILSAIYPLLHAEALRCSYILRHERRCRQTTAIHQQQMST